MENSTFQEKKYLLNSLEQTYVFGEALGKILKPNDVLALKGDLGTGKTTLTHGIALGLGINTPISSPTFTLLFEHTSSERQIPLYHFDAYRLEDEYEWYDAGFMDYLHNDGVSIIEWADRIEAALPKETIWLSLRTIEPNHRKVELKSSKKFCWQNLLDWEIN